VSENASPEPPSAKAVSPAESDEMKKSTESANSGSIRGGLPVVFTCYLSFKHTYIVSVDVIYCQTRVLS